MTASTQPGSVGASARARRHPGRGWTPGRIVGLTTGILFAFVALVLLVGGFGLLVANTQFSDDDGYLSGPARNFSTTTSVISSDSFDLQGAEEWPFSGGDPVKLRIGAEQLDKQQGDIFVGIAPTAQVEQFLAPINHVIVRDFGNSLGEVDYTTRMGTLQAPRPAAAKQVTWVASAHGRDVQLDWVPRKGDYTLVLMNASGKPVVNARLDPAARVPFLNVVAVGMVLGGLLFAAGAIVIISLVALARGGRSRPWLRRS